MHNFDDDDFQAEQDMRTVLNAKEIEQDPGRMIAAKNFAISEAQRFKQIADEIPDPEKKGFDGAVKNSKMNRNA